MHHDSSGKVDLVEKDVNLRIALLLADMLIEEGYEVVLTRTGDSLVNTAGEDLNGDGKVTVEDDLQARVDLINASQADILLSIHHNGFDSPMRGTSTYFCADRPFAERRVALRQFGFQPFALSFVDSLAALESRLRQLGLLNRHRQLHLIGGRQ